MVDIHPDTHYSVVTIVNWPIYQQDALEIGQATGQASGQAKDRQRTHTRMEEVDQDQNQDQILLHGAGAETTRPPCRMLRAEDILSLPKTGNLVRQGATARPRGRKPRKRRGRRQSVEEGSPATPASISCSPAREAAAAERAALRSARQAVAAGELDPAEAVHRLVRENEVPLHLAISVIPEAR
jgi:hypothetical protein